MRAKRLKRPRRSSQTTAARASCARSAPNDRVVKETTASCVPNASNDRVLRRNDAGLQGMLCPLHKTTLDYKVFHAHCIKRHWITRYSMPVTRNDTGFSTAINVAAKCPPIMLRWHGAPDPSCFGPPKPNLAAFMPCFGLFRSRNTCASATERRVSAQSSHEHMRSACMGGSLPPASWGVRNCFGTETVSVPKQFRRPKQLRGRNSFGTETVSVPKHLVIRCRFM